MSHVARLTCVCCHAVYPTDGPWTCPACGPDDGVLDVELDLEAVRKTMNRDALAGRVRSHWRYRELLPVDTPHPLPADVGWTPLIDAPRLAKELGVRRVRLKDDGRNPSGSFKDRPSSVAVNHAIERGATTVACASTGNAASSLAGCAAAAGLRCAIFVSQLVPDAKLAQLLAYGACVFKIRGTYADAYDLCTQSCERFGWYNRNAGANPYLVEGKKTGGLEVAEQCAEDPPDWVACSVGDGCSIAAVHKGLAQMREIGLIDWQARVLGVQAAAVSPVLRAFATGKLDRSGKSGTYADSIDVPIPRNWRKAIHAVRASGGDFVAVADEQIMHAVRTTGRLTGVFAEPAAGAAIAGVVEARARGLLGASSDVVIMITGNGLKDVGGAMRAVGEPHEIEPRFEEVVRAVEAGRLDSSSNL
ncbi:MAG: threonine synthase [Planctomycetes bacterium]|nr:threonine synthase [Planctomycetota bacterium]